MYLNFSSVEPFTPKGAIGIVLAVLGFAYLVLNFVIRPLLFNPLRNIPVAPGRHWFFGHIRRILKDPTGAPAREWINSVPNDGMIRYYMMWTPRILLTKPEAIADVTVNNSYDFVKSHVVRNILSRVTGIGLILQEGDVHKTQRKALTPAFAYRRTKNIYPIFWDKARQLVQCLERESSSGSAVEISIWASRTTMDIVGLGSMGIDFDSLANPDNALASAFRTIVTLPVSSPAGKRISLLRLILPNDLVNSLPCQYNHDINSAVSTIRSACSSMIAAKRKTLAESKLSPEDAHVDVLSAALASDQFSDDQLVDHAMTFLSAGHEASANAISSALMLLCQHPGVQTRLRKEIRERVPGLEGEIEPADVDRCDYLQAVCFEVLRFWPPLTQSYRSVYRDTEIAGQVVPKGTSIVLCFWAINASKELWGEDALEFKPERWLDANGRVNAGGGSVSNYAFSTFLHGPRSCIGQRFAQAGFACTLAALIGTFEVGFEEGSPLAKGEAEFGGTISNKPRGGMRCTLKKLPGWG